MVETVERHVRLVLLCSHRSQPVKQSSYIDLLATGAIDGMLYLGSFRSSERLAVAIAGGLPVVAGPRAPARTQVLPVELIIREPAAPAMAH